MLETPHIQESSMPKTPKNLITNLQKKMTTAIFKKNIVYGMSYFTLPFVLKIMYSS